MGIGAALVALALGAQAPEAWAQQPELPQPEQAVEPEQVEEEAAAPTPAIKRKPQLLLLPTQSVEGEVTPLVSERIDESLRVKLKGDNKVVLMPSFEQIREDLAGAGASSAVILEAEGLYASGIGLLTAGENEQAAQSFQRAVELMEQNIASLQNYEVLVDALSNLALAYHLTGYDVDGRKRIQQLAHLRPEIELDEEKYPAELREVLLSEQAKIAKAGPGQLTITTPKPGATITIDGVERGVTPLTVELGFGYHYVVARDASGQGHGEQVRMRGQGKVQELALQLGDAIVSGGGATGEAGPGQMPAYYADLVITLEGGELDAAQLQPYLDELSKQAGAPLIGWVLIYEQSGSYVAAPFVWRASDGVMAEGESRVFNMELSNLVLGINRMSGDLATLAAQMPEARRIERASVGAPQAPAVVATPTPSASVVTPPPAGYAPSGAAGSQGGVTTLAEIDPVEERDESRRGLKIAGGVAAAAVVLGGVIVGGLLLSEDGSDDPDNAGGYSAEVSW